tara:strand:+ start:881 stop:1459 length:579 start_codon:yes stop_codon:yes gene_type:complete
MKNVIKGKAMWAKVYDPDFKFDPNGIYSVSVLVPEEEAQEMCEHLDSLAKKRLAEEMKDRKRNDLTLRTPYEKATDKDGNETGEIEFKIKMRAKFQSKQGQWFTNKPIVVDSKRTPLDKETLIGNGSVIKVVFDTIPYVMMSSKTCSVSLRMKGVQVLQLVEYQGDLFEDEDGFIAKAADDNIGEVAVEADF